MVNPIRPGDATGVYRRLVGAAADAAEATEGTTRARAGTPGGSRHVDEVSISESGQTLRRLIDAVSAQPDVRADRVAQLKAQIERGEYRLDSATVAERMIDEGVR